MLRHTESVEVYKALVSALADNLLPTASIGVTFFIIGFYAYLETGAVAALAITVFGVAASLGKALFILVHRRTIAGPTPALADFRKVEAGHAITSWCMAAPMGAQAPSLGWVCVRARAVIENAVLIFSACSSIELYR